MKMGHVYGTKHEKQGSTDWYRTIEAEHIARIEAEEAARPQAVEQTKVLRITYHPTTTWLEWLVGGVPTRREPLRMRGLVPHVWTDVLGRAGWTIEERHQGA